MTNRAKIEETSPISVSLTLPEGHILNGQKTGEDKREFYMGPQDTPVVPVVELVRGNWQHVYDGFRYRGSYGLVVRRESETLFQVVRREYRKAYNWAYYQRKKHNQPIHQNETTTS